MYGIDGEKLFGDPVGKTIAIEIGALGPKHLDPHNGNQSPGQHVVDLEVEFMFARSQHGGDEAQEGVLLDAIHQVTLTEGLAVYLDFHFNDLVQIEIAEQAGGQLDAPETVLRNSKYPGEFATK